MATTNTTPLTPAEMEMALAARRAYQRAYKAEHRDEVNAQRRRYYAAHPEKQREANLRYWLKKAQREAEGGADRGGD